VDVHFRPPSKEYDAVFARVRDARLDLADWIRRALKIAQALTDTDTDTDTDTGLHSQARGVLQK